MKVLRALITPVVKVAFFVNSISAKIITFLVVNLLGGRSIKGSKPEGIRKRFK